LEPQAPVQNKGPTTLWVPFVLAVGIVVGLIASYLAPSPFVPFRFGPDQFREVLTWHILLSTVSIALLVALFLVYFRIYAQTGARFALGIMVVLFALLIQQLFQYPLLLGLAGPFPVGQGLYLSFADLFTIVAYTIFLYLSLD
jgi:hypothetical protein